MKILTHGPAAGLVLAVAVVAAGIFGVDSPDAERQPSVDDAVRAKYNRSCVACHATGASGAPRSFEVSEWELQLAKGMDELLKNTRDGYQAMPPMGLCIDCDDDDLRALILYMTQPADSE